MVDRGVNGRVAMKIGGWETEAMLRRYHIVDKTELIDASEKLDAEQAQSVQKPTEQPAQQDTQRPRVDCTSTTMEVSQPASEEKGKGEVPQSQQDGWWAHQDLNLGPTDYESAALTN